MSTMRKRVMVISLIALLALLLAPIPVAAVTNSDIVAILKEVIAGVLGAGRDAYCAAGVAALCK